MLAPYIQYKHIYITKYQLNSLIGIGYILPTFGTQVQGRGVLIVRYEYALHCIALHCTVRHEYALHCIALHCIVRYEYALHCMFAANTGAVHVS